MQQSLIDTSAGDAAPAPAPRATSKGIAPGDIYQAVSPAAWLNARGLNP